MNFKYFLVLILSFFFGQFFVHANDLSLNEIRFTNRAHCALDSKKPTDSAFVLLSNLDIAKAIYRLGKNKNVDTKEFTKKGILAYRQTTLNLLQLIHSKLINRELPLLVSDITNSDTHAPAEYQQLMQKCSSDEYCDELDSYIKSIWTISTSKKPLAERQLDFYKLDNYHSKLNFLQNNIFDNNERVFEYKCHYLKKFSPLDAQLFGTKPDASALESIAKAALQKNEYISDCFDFTNQENLKVATYEIKIPNLDEKNWNIQGHDYWNSLKLYFSWAFRNAPEVKTYAMGFDQLFYGLAIEDSLLIVPDNCKSITPPKCESEYLNQNAIREFAKSSFKKDAVNLDILDSVPEGAQGDLLKDPFTEVNKDILSMGDFPSADAWLDSFRENFQGSRTIIKRKLLRSVNFLDLAQKNISADKLISKIKSKFYLSMNASLSPDDKNNLKNELFYVCSEFTFATHEDLSFIKTKIDLLNNLQLLDKLTYGLVSSKSNQYFEYYSKISSEVNKLCGQVNQNLIWDKDFSLDKTGFSSWYLDKVYDNKIKSTENDRIKNYLINNSPAFSYSSFSITKSINDVVCAHELDCARKTLKSMIDLYSAVQYADTFWTLDQKLKTPSIYNPYAERTACRVYDPWFKTKQTLFNFFTDMAQGAIATVAPGVLFATVDLVPGKVVSFNQLVKDGKIVYNTKFDKVKVQAGLTADFGNLLGVPCAITISNDEPNPYNFLQFTGISARACTDKEKYQVNVTSASDIGANEQTKVSGCVVCALNFDTVSKSIETVTKTAAPQFFMVRAIVRLYRGLKDSMNIPRSWTAKPELVLASFEKHGGKIPEKCIGPLSKSQACMANSCESEIVKELDKKFNAKYLTSNIDQLFKGVVTAKIAGCTETIKMKAHRGQWSRNDDLKDINCRIQEIQVPASCQSLVRK